jgi:lambda repressor-like predicted transcriptional regulator
MSDIARSLELAPSTIHAVVSGRSYSKRVAELIASKLELQVEEIWPEKISKKG